MLIKGERRLKTQLSNLIVDKYYDESNFHRNLTNHENKNREINMSDIMYMIAIISKIEIMVVYP